MEGSGTELAERLQDLLEGFGRTYRWRVVFLPDERPEPSGGFEIHVSDGRQALGRLVSRLHLDTMTVSLWDYAELTARQMIRDFEEGRTRE